MRSLCNTTHNKKRYVPITGHRRQNFTRTKYINLLDHHRPFPQNDGCDGQESPPGYPAYASVDTKKCGSECQKKKKTRNMTKNKHATLQKLQHRKPTKIKKGVSINTKTGDKMFNTLKLEI